MKPPEAGGMKPPEAGGMKPPEAGGMKPPEAGQPTETTNPEPVQPPAAATKDAESLAELKEQVAQLQKQLEALSQNQSKS